MEYKKLSELKKLPGNPRTITKQDMARLVESIGSNPSYFEARPLILSDRTGDLVIIAGNQRFEAAKIRKMAKVPTYTLKGLTEGQEKEIIIRDNVSNGEWDFDLLANEWDLNDLAEWGVDLPIEVLDEQKIIEDEAPEVDNTVEPESQLGEVYLLGRHRLMCGSATELEDVEKLMGGELADLIFTDPPYGVSYDGAGGTAKDKRWEVIKNDKLRGADLNAFLADAFANAHLVSKDSVPFYCWFSPKTHVEFRTALEAAGWEYKEELIWNKGMSLSGADYQYAHEPVFYFQKEGQKAQWFGGRNKKTILGMQRWDIAGMSQEQLVEVVTAMLTEGTVWDVNRDSVTTYQHPTQKPAVLSARAIKNSSDVGHNVLDLFAGSGSTLMGAEHTKRNAFCMELDPKYVDVIRKRYHIFVNGSEDGWKEGTPCVA